MHEIHVIRQHCHLFSVGKAVYSSYSDTNGITDSKVGILICDTASLSRK